MKLHIQNTEACRLRWEAWIEQTQRTRTSGPSTSLRTPDDNNNMATVSLETTMNIDTFFSPIEETPRSHRATVEDKPDDEEIARFVRYYPAPVAQVLRRGESTFEEWRRVNEKDGRPRWAPFANEEEWKLAHWLLKNVGQNKIDEFLKLDIVRSCLPAF